MVLSLSKRERTVAIVTLALILLFILDQYAWSPFMEAVDRVSVEKQGLLAEMQRAERTFKRRTALGDAWNRMKEGGLSEDVSGTESRALNAIRKWASECNMTLSTIKPDREKVDGSMQEILFHVTLNGSMDSVSRFLWQVEKTVLPLRMKEFQLGSGEENGSNLSLQIKLSALYLAETSEAPDVESAGKSKAAAEENL